MAGGDHCPIGPNIGCGEPLGARPSASSVSELRSIVARTYEVFNARDFGAYAELLDEDVELVMSGMAVRGLAAVTDFIAVTARARPGLRIEPLRVFADTGDTLVTEIRMVDTAAEEPGTVEASGCGLYRGAGGRIAEWRVYLDPVGEELASAALTAVAAEQSALRRVAELVARQAPPEQMFALVTEELSQLLDVNLVRTVRFEPDGSATILASRGAGEDMLGPGTNVPLPRGTVIDQVFRTGRPARVEGYAHVAGRVGDILRQEGARSGAGGPILVDGQLWGAMAVGSSLRTLVPGTEERVAQFAELVSTAISNLESRAQVERLAAEQSALRHVATLVAREHSPDDLFATLAEEVGVLLGVDGAGIVRYDDDANATLVAIWSDEAIRLERGQPIPVDGETLAGEVLRTGMPSRKQDYSAAPRGGAARMRARGIRSAVASPIVVDGATWGIITVLSGKPDPLPPDTEARLAKFCQVAGMAVSNAKSRSDLAESRARIVRAGDEARRRFERDLHDGAQQRLVSLGLALRAAEATVPPELGELRRVLSRLETGLSDVLDDLRELSRGLHPAVLSEGGLGPALRSLARRSAVPVDVHVDLDDERFEEPVEVAAFYVASEALTNAAKHARASRAKLTASHRKAWLELMVSDDGRGGADASSGSGLTGLVDRVEAIGGTIQIESPQAAGTAVQVKLPVPRPSDDRVTNLR